MDELMADIFTRIIAGDMNIDCETNCDTAEYIDMLLTNNFMPVLVMPRCITTNSTTLIDHITLTVRAIEILQWLKVVITGRHN
jgi:hypothetical protein